MFHFLPECGSPAPTLFGFCWSNSVVATLGLERILWAQWAGAVSSSSLACGCSSGGCGQTQAQHPALPLALSFLVNECSLSPEGSSEVYNSIWYCWFSQGPTVPPLLISSPPSMCCMIPILCPAQGPLAIYGTKLPASLGSTLPECFL